MRPQHIRGKDQSKIQLIVEAVRNTPGCTVLGVEPDHDYHRTVITFAGEPHAVADGAVALIEKSIEVLDMRTHHGEHHAWAWSMSAHLCRFKTPPWKNVLP